MTTTRQTKANQDNAKKSTGACTEEGKIRSSMNAIKHGMMARNKLMPDESPEQFEMYFSGLLMEFQPESVVEIELVGQLADLGQRLLRVARYEVLAVESYMQEVELDGHGLLVDLREGRIPEEAADDEAVRKFAGALTELLPEEERLMHAGRMIFAKAVTQAIEKGIFDKLSRYGRSILRDYLLVLKELERLQDARRRRQEAVLGSGDYGDEGTD